MTAHDKEDHREQCHLTVCRTKLDDVPENRCNACGGIVCEKHRVSVLTPRGVPQKYRCVSCTSGTILCLKSA